MSVTRTALNTTNLIVFLIGALLLARLVDMALLPLMDTTEARYGEIARKMAELGDWVTPWHDDGVPFWGKPPLAFWVSAMSFRLFGVSEFTARLPHFLLALLIGAMVWDLARRNGNRRTALFAVAVLASSTLFLVSTGAMMTDMALTLGTTMTLYGFWLAFEGGDPVVRGRGGYLFFLGVAVGLLAKGPLILVLAGLPLVLWVSLERRWKTVFASLPWIGGPLLVALIALPWYWLAELKTPGFLDYFIIGENWHRFVTPGWQGDLYGRAHRFPPGTIWLFGFVALLPWSVSAPFGAWWWRREAAPADRPASTRAWRRYLLLWALVPFVFLTAARNIIWTYPLPVLPAAVLFIAGWLAHRSRQADAWVVTGLSIALALTMVVGGARIVRPDLFDRATARPVVAAYERAKMPGEPLIFLSKRPYSAAFYSRNEAHLAENANALGAELTFHARAIVAVPSSIADALSGRRDLEIETDFGRYGAYTLFRVRRPPPATPEDTGSDGTGVHQAMVRRPFIAGWNRQT